MQPETLYQELAQGAEIIHALVMGVMQAEACVKPQPESWSILEVVCHLLDEEREDFRQRLAFVHDVYVAGGIKGCLGILLYEQYS